MGTGLGLYSGIRNLKTYLALYTLFQKSWQEIQIGKEKKFNIEAKLRTFWCLDSTVKWSFKNYGDLITNHIMT